MHAMLMEIQKSLYLPNGLACANLVTDSESSAYNACTFELNCKRILFRTAHITPTKIGQFVTLWKRIGNGPILPYDKKDPIDFVIITVKNKEQLGHFIFPIDLLCRKDIFSTDGTGGKRAIRVYPPWDITTNKQAQKTQAWQISYFVELQPHINIDQLKQLLSVDLT